MGTRLKRILLNILNSIITIIIIIVALFALVNIVFNFVYIKTNVRGFSMLPTLNANVLTDDQNGDKVYINPNRAYTNGDIVVAEVSWWNRGYIIKRLVGMPGDVIQIKEEETQYVLLVNDEVFYTKDKINSATNEIDTGVRYYFEDYLSFINNPLNADHVIVNDAGERCIKLGEDEYFLMGDNWAASTDCIVHGPVNKSAIIGKVEIIIHYGENEFRVMLKNMWEILF